MPVFSIVLSESNAQLVERIEDKYPHCYKFNDLVYLVEGDFLAEEVAVEVGIKGDDRVEKALGAVFKLNRSYAGYASRSLWDWLLRSEESERNSVGA